MPGDSEEITRLRKPRFSYEENQILIREVRANYGKLYGSQSRRVTVAERRRVWEGIAAKINSITSWRRTGQEVQKRWNDFKRRTKEKLARVPHSTQGAGQAGEEAFSAEEETLFAILGPGVMTGTGGAEAGALSSTPGFGPSSYRLPAEPDTDAPARVHASCSPETSGKASCCGLERALLRPKERDSPAPPPAQPSSLQIVQLAPSPSNFGCRPHPGHSAGELLDTVPCPSTSPPPPRQDTYLDLPVQLPPDFLQVQRETAEAIRELTDTLRQGLDRLADVVAALLPLLPPPPSALLHPQGEFPPSPVAPSAETPPAGGGAPTKAEVTPEQEEKNKVGLLQPAGDSGAAREPSPSRAPPPQKWRKSIPPRKRRGRWKPL